MTVRDNVCSSMRALAEIEGSRVNFAKRLGVSKQTVSNWVNGSNAPDIEMIAIISNMYHIPMSDILEGRVQRREENVLKSDWVEVPLYGSIAAGKPIEMQEIDDTFVIPSNLREKYPKSFLLKVVGESMNKILPNGSYALINPVSEVADGKAAAVCVNGYDATIKRVKTLSNGIELCPDSTDPTIRPMVFDYADPDAKTVTVIGEVVWCVFPFDFSF